VPVTPPQKLLCDRFSLQELYKAAQGIEIWTGVDTLSGANVLLKVAFQESSSRARLVREGQALSRIRSPHVPPLLHLEETPEHVVLAQPLLPGQTLEERLRDAPLTLEEGLRLGRALFSALEASHAAGILHRDVKPANLVLNDSCRQVSLIDFGLCQEVGVPSGVAGTLRYLAPEAAGLLPEGSLTESADLYSAGMVLLEGWTGQPAFAQETPAEILRAHLSQAPTRLRQLRPDLPRVLEELLARLVRKDPGQRYQRAAAVGRDLEQLAVLCDSVSEPFLVLGLSDTNWQLREPEFVVRLEPLAQLQRLERGVMLVCGASGSGKTRLLEELARSRRWPLLLQSRAWGHGSNTPLQMLDDLSRDLWARCQLDPVLTETLRQKLVDHREALVVALPALAPLLQTDLRPGHEPLEHGQERVLLAVCALLQALGPCLVLLDDVQWADGLTWKLLQRGHEAGTGEALVVASLRDEERPAQIPPLPELKLPPLQLEETERLLQSMAGNLPADAAPLVHQCCDGNLFLAVEILRGMAESGMLRAGDGGWQLDRLQTSKRAAVSLRHRVPNLPPESLRSLSLAALLGREFRLDLLEVLAGEAASLAPACQRGILWEVGSGRYAFAHDRLREDCLERLPEEERPNLHAAVARYLEGQGEGQEHALAHHFHCAGQIAQAFPYALRAAQQSASRYALDLAEREYGLALSGIAGANLAQRLQVRTGLGDVLHAGGCYQEAAEQFEAGLLEAEGFQRAEYLARLGVLEMSQGHCLEADRRFREALASQGRRLPSMAFGQILGSLWAAGRHVWHRLRGVGSNSPPDAPARLAMVVQGHMTLNCFFLHRPLPMLWSHLDAMSYAEQFAQTTQLGAAYSLHATILASLSWYSEALAYANRGLVIQRQVGSRMALGKALRSRGFVHLLQASLAAAADDYAQARSMLSQGVDLFEESMASQNQVHLFYLQGQLGKACQLGAEFYRQCQSRGDLLGEASALRYWVRASGGLLEADVALAEPAPDEPHRVRALFLREALGVAWLYRGQPARAVEWLEEAVRQPGHPMEMGSTYCWLASAYRLLLERAPDPTLESKLSSSLRRALKLSRKYRASLPHALREEGLRAGRMGQVQPARRLLEESLQQARALGMPYEEARTLQARARLGGIFAWPGARHDGLEADRLFASVGALWELPAQERITVSMADRYTQLMEGGSRIAGALTRTDILQQVVGAAEMLLRVEKIRILEDGSTSPLVARALELGQTLTWEEGLPDDCSESGILTGVRCALACPIDGRACLYASHTQLGRLFGPEELHLAQFVAALARTALANAASFEERVRMQSALDETEANFQALFLGVGLGIAVVDGEGVILESNPTLSEMVELRPGLCFEEVVHLDDREDFLAALRRVCELGATVSLEQRYQGRNRNTLWGQLTISPLADQKLVVALSDVSYRKLRQVALFAENERRTLSSELHDVVSQPLAGVSMLLQVLSQMSEDRCKPIVRQASQACEQLLGSLGSLMFTLRTPTLSGPQLAEALRDSLERFQQDSAVAASLELRGSLDETPELTAIFLYRIVQESLQNVLRHARAGLVEVELEGEGGLVRGWVRDDGVGFGVDDLPSSPRSGVRGMRGRAELLGGWLQVHSRPGQGTRIQFELPGRHAL
jgi:two-component system sensor kinase